MKLTRLRCPNCGADFENVDLEQDQRVFKCTRLGCGATFIVDQGEKFADIEKREAEKIEQYRMEMNNALSPFDQYLAMRYAENIIAILPNDFRAKAVLSIAQSNDSNKRPLYNFLSSGSDCTTEEFEEIFPVFLRHCDYRGLKLLEESIQTISDSQAKSKMQVQINRQMSYLKKKNDDYADVPRDVFVCHSSDDIDIAMKVVNALEDDGNKCWISERNMPPDSRYYWEKIEKSIQHCTIFLVICSNIAMHSDAVQREIGIAESSKVERLELKLDDTPHTVLFKHFFDGINWIDATKDKNHAIKQLKEWVYQLKRTKSTDAEKNPVDTAKRKNQEDIINLKLEQEKLSREKELRQQRIEVEKQRIEEKNIEKEKNKVSKKKKILLALFVLLPGLGLLSQTVDAFRNNNILRGIVLILPTMCLLTAWLFGRRIIKKKNYLMWPLLIIGYALFYCINVNDTKQVIPAVTVKDNSIVPTIASDITTNESEGIYTYQIRDYVGKNAASIGKPYGNDLTDEYGHGRIKIIFVTEDGTLLDSEENLIKNYVVTSQNIPARKSLVMIHTRNSRGEPYDNLVSYQNYDEILLYAAPIGETPYTPDSIEPLPTLDRHYYHVRDYVGRNAASFGEKYSDYRVDEYGHGKLRINFIADDGSFVDKNDINSLRNYVVINQDIPANTILELIYTTNSKGIEYENLVQSMNYEEINLYVKKIDDKLTATNETLPTEIATLVLTETDNDTTTNQTLPTVTPTMLQSEVFITTYEGLDSFPTELKVGDVFTFGKYEQDNDLSNDFEPIEWQTLTVEDGRALVISKYVLDEKKYNYTDSYTTWSSCSLRKWLNEDFYDDSFSELEKKQIIQVILKNPEHPEYGTSGGSETQDNIFLLSIREVEKYMRTEDSRICSSTPYAESKVIYYWWLRTPGAKNSQASTIGIENSMSKGKISYDRVNSGGRGVRPAFWISLETNSEKIIETHTPTPTAVPSSIPITVSSNAGTTSKDNNYQTPVKPVIINQENGNYTITEFGYSIQFGRYFQYSIIIHNNVSDRVIENPTFRIVVRDATGKVIGLEEKDLHRIYPGQDEYYANQAFSIEEMPATVEVQVTGADDDSKLKYPNLVTHPEFIPIEFSGVSIQGTYFMGELYNPNDYDINRIIICALYRDENNALIDGQCGTANNVGAKETVPFKISGGRSKAFSSYEIHGQLWRLD